MPDKAEHPILDPSDHYCGTIGIGARKRAEMKVLDGGSVIHELI